MIPHNRFVLAAALLLSTLMVATFCPTVAAQTHGNNPNPYYQVAAAFPPATQIVPGGFCDNVETGNLGWTETVASNDLQTGLHVSTWHITTRNSYSPTHSWWIGNEALGNYNTGLVHRSLTSPPLTINGPSATLSYRSYYSTIESGTGWDVATVWVHTSSGFLLVKTIVSWDPEDGAGWLLFIWDISSLAGQTVSIVLEFNTRDTGMNAGQGWFVDDICVTTAPPIVIPEYPFGLAVLLVAVVGLYAVMRRKLRTA